MVVEHTPANAHRDIFSFTHALSVLGRMVTRRVGRWWR